MKKRAPKNSSFLLSEEQGKVVRSYLASVGIAQTSIASRVPKSKTEINAYLHGKKGINQNVATKIWEILGRPDQLDFLCNLEENATRYSARNETQAVIQPPRLDCLKPYSLLRDYYLDTVKRAFDNQPNAGKLKILEDLEELVKKYDANTTE